MTGTPSSDALSRFVFDHAPVRGALVCLDAASCAILDCHPYPPALRRVLAELLAASALLSSTLKFTGSLVVQLQGDGPVRLLVVECNDALQLRATAQWDTQRTAALGPDATLAELAGGATRGRMVITLDPKGRGTIYQGIVTLETASIAALIEHYLTTSEQLASRIVLAADAGRARGLLVQRLPGNDAAMEHETDETWTRASERVARIDPATLFAPGAPEALIAACFTEDDVRVFTPRTVSFHCPCSPERVKRALRIAGRPEIESILAERGNVVVTCEFCNHDYSFGPSEARAIFATGVPPVRH
ncbi:MAG TPA: Hsp33 family molecular chaperone HslO [Casimicrobiaceae bacterium]|nr:Hsp33 family molecular chaperone HslO [Casimicrobiaceae bacterium]